MDQFLQEEEKSKVTFLPPPIWKKLIQRPGKSTTLGENSTRWLDISRIFLTRKEKRKRGNIQQSMFKNLSARLVALILACSIVLGGKNQKKSAKLLQNLKNSNKLPKGKKWNKKKSFRLVFWRRALRSKQLCNDHLSMWNREQLSILFFFTFAKLNKINI